MLSIIVAVTKNWVIGNEGKIPWRIKGEQVRFRELTTGNTIIMGRRSFEEIGKPLPKRKTILISNSIKVEEENCTTVGSFMEAYDMVKDMDGEVFVAGGGRVYKEAFPYVDKIYLTIIDMEIEGDTFFPEVTEEEFEKVFEERIEGEIPYTYYTFVRK
ncbi:MAG: dihydrofolate reductase [Lachnospiraceae bacterium]|nr:dihydrofolate reductase [Lachnospiraceae bacterium]